MYTRVAGKSLRYFQLLCFFIKETVVGSVLFGLKKIKIYYIWVVPWVINHKKHKDRKKCFDGSEFVELFSLIILIKKMFTFVKKWQ